MIDAPRDSDRRPPDEVQLEDLPPRPAVLAGVGLPRPSPDKSDDDIVPIEDLMPRTNVKGGRKVIRGEILPPSA